jgi:hypothetical protein
MKSTWDIIASAETWHQVLAEKLNLSVAMRRHLIRYCDQGDTGPVTADTRISMLADLLGVTSWGRDRQTPPVAANGTR